MYVKSDVIKDTDVFYSSKTMKVSEAFSMVIRRMIEEDLPNSRFFDKGKDPYSWLASTLKKSEKTIRNWTFDWNTASGTMPTINDFLTLLYLTKSKRPVELLENITSDATPEEQEKNHGDTIIKVSRHIRDLADTLEKMYSKKTG